MQTLLFGGAVRKCFSKSFRPLIVSPDDFFYCVAFSHLMTRFCQLWKAASWLSCFLLNVLIRMHNRKCNVLKSFLKYLDISGKFPVSMNSFKINSESISNVSKEVIQVSLLLTLNIHHILFCCLHCWLWTSKCRLDEFQILSIRTYVFRSHLIRS